MARSLPPGTRHLVGLAFGVRRGWYRLRYPRLEIGRGVMFIGRLRLRQGTRLSIGDRTRVRGTVIVNGGGSVVVGADSLLNGCWILAADSVRLGERCLVSDCGITDNDFHNPDPSLRHETAKPDTRAPVTIGDNVWLGTHALVLKGVHIGEDSLVGAGAVVRRDVPAAAVVAGNPAQVVRSFR